MHRNSRFTLVMMAILLMFGMLGIQPAKPVQAVLATDLFFSEYIEGTYSNKAIEIFNGTGAPVDLTEYRLELYSNGASSPSASVVLSGTLLAGDVFVAANGAAAQPILDKADLVNNSVANWSGDDAIALRKISTNSFVDVFGQIGVDPGSYWGTNPIITENRTLVRKVDICAGDPDGSNAFAPANEWNQFPTDTIEYLGSHTSNCVLNEAEALAWLQGNTTLTGTLGALTATFPASIPPVIVAEDYVIDSRITFDAALPSGTTISVSRDGVPYITDLELTGAGPFWLTNLIPGASRAPFDADYGAAVENYVITVTGPGTNPLDFDTTVRIESVISKDWYLTETVLDDITLDVNIPADEEAALLWLQENTSISGTLDNFQANFPLEIPPVVVDAGYYINSRITLGEELPEGSLVTIGRDGVVVFGPAELTGAGPWWYTELLGYGLSVSAPFDHGYDDQLENYSVTITGSHDAINTTLTVQSVISKDLTDFDPLVVLASHTMDVVFDETIAPVMEAVTPAEGVVTLAADETFVLTVDALDLNLYELEIDHSFEGTLPEFSVYADALNPWGTPEDKAQFDAAGVTISYDADLQQWTIDFGETITDIFIPHGVTFYMVLYDEAGNKWGSMSPTTPDNTYAYTFEVSNTLEVEIASAPLYNYSDGYVYVGDSVFDDPNNIYTNTYSPAEFLAGGAMNDLARYLGALYRQDISTIIEITSEGVVYTWDPTEPNTGSNWYNGTTSLVSAMVADYLAAPGDLVITVGDGWHTSDVTFRLLISNTLDDEIESAPSYVYEPIYTYVGARVFDDATNLYTVTYDDLDFNPNAMYDLARYLGALYRQTGATVTSIVYGGVTYTWSPTGTLHGSNWVDGSGKTLVSAVVAGIGSYDPAVGLVFTVSDGVHNENVTFKFVITDTTAPVVSKIETLSATDGNFTAVGTTLTVVEGYTVDTIEITLSEPVVVAPGTFVTMDGFGPYGTIAASGNKLIVTPNPGNETAVNVGTFTFSVPAGSIADPSGNELGAVSLTLVVQDASFFVTQDFGPWDQVAYPGWVNLGWQYLPGFDPTTIASIEIGMKDAAGDLIVKYTASGDQIVYQRDNGYINPDTKQSSLPFYQYVAPGFSTAGEPILEGPDLDVTVLKGPAFTAWAPASGYICVVDTEGTEDCKTVTYSGDLPLVVGTLTANDFGYWATSTTVGDVIGYTAGFSLDVKFTDATIVVELYSGDTLLQTNTSVDGMFDHLNGISGPFDVFGTFNYVTDGYWTNVRGAEFGEILIPTKVVATATLASGKVVTAENTLLTSTLENSLPMVEWQTTLTGNVTPDGILATFPLSIPQVVVDEPYKINSQITLGVPLPAGSLVSVTRNGVPLLTNATLTGTGPWWITDLLGAPLSASADFDANYGGSTELYMITITGNTQPINTTLTLNSIISRDGFDLEKVVLAEETFDLVVSDVVPPVVTISGATADGMAMGGTLEDGYILPTTNDPAINHLLQIVATVSEPLADEYFGLYLTGATPEQIAALEAYYADKSEPYQTYLLEALAGTKPFVYIDGGSLTLVDAAQHDLDDHDVPMVVPDDFPLGTYTVQGVVTDEAGNETMVTLILVVTGDRVAPIVTISSATADGTTMGGSLGTGYVLITGNVPTEDHLLQISATVDTPLADEYFGLYFVEGESTISAAQLKAYYDARGVPSEPLDFLGYLKGAADGTNPFVFIKEDSLSLSLVDAAKHALQGQNVDMTIPDDFPVGTYVVRGNVADEAGNETMVTLKLIVVRTLAVTDADLFYGTDLGTITVPLRGDFETGFVMELDQLVPWYYLDTNVITSNNELAEGMYPFYLDPEQPAVFYVNVDVAGEISLIDGWLYQNMSETSPLRINGDFTPGTYTYIGGLTDIFGSITPVSIKITFVAPMAITNADLYYGTETSVIEQPLAGTFTGGFTLVLDPAVAWYYFDTQNITSTRPIADGSYPFYLEGTTTEVFTLVVSGTDYFLRDTYANDGTPLRVQGNFPLGSYTYVGEVADEFGFIDEVSLTITFVAPLAITNADLKASTVSGGPYTALSGSYADGFVMEIDPLVPWYYLDTDMITANNELADGLYPFYLATDTTTPVFYVRVAGTEYTLMDAYLLDRDGVEMPLRINGDFTPGTYTYAGALADIYGSSAPVSIKITFVNALAITDADLFYGTDPIVIDQALDGTFADGFVMELDPLVEWYYLDTDMVTSNNTLADGRYTFYESTDDTQPIFYLDIAAGEFSLIDAYKWLVDGVISPLRINGDFTPGTYTYIGDVTDIYGSTAPLSIEITFVNALAITDADLKWSLTPGGTYSTLEGNFTDGFSMYLDPTLDWLYLDTDMITSNNTLADGLYPLYLASVPDPIFFVKVDGTNYTLIDGYLLANGGGEQPLRINGDFAPDTYTYTGELTDIFGSSAPVSIEITFIDALTWLQGNTTLTGTLDDLNATFPASIPSVIVAQPYKINSCYTLGEALPAGTTVTLVRGTTVIFSDEIGSQTEFCYTDLIPGATPADIDAGYAGTTEHYEITVTGPGGNPLAFDTTLKIQSIISKDGFMTPVVLAEITLPVNIPADEAAALLWLQGNTTLSGTLDNLVATFPTSIPPVIVAEEYVIDSRITFAEALPTGTKISVSRDGVPYITNLELTGEGPFWLTDLIPGATRAAFDAGYGGAVENYVITVTGPGTNPLDFDTTVLIESVISKDGYTTETVLADITLPVHLDDAVAPVMEEVLPAEGALLFGPDDTFVLTVDALDLNLYELEIDHSLWASLPEFSLYADAANPWGTPEDQAAFAAAGVTVSYDDVEQVWTIDFGPTVTDAFIANGGITFYMVLYDDAGNQWGTMYGTTPDNTYVYTITLDDVAPDVTVIGATADGDPMGGDLATGYVLITENVPTVDHLLQISATVDAPLADEYFGLYFVEAESTVSADTLKAYYDARGVPEPYLAFLKGAADGTNPFVFIDEDDLSLSLVDAAKHALLGDDVDMTIPDDFPIGTYVVRGNVADTVGNETIVTLKLIVVRTLAITDADLKASTVSGGPYTTLPGTYAGGFVMEIDPMVPWYYLDTDMITANNELADGLYPFYLATDTTTPVFYVRVAGTEYTLMDAYLLDRDGVEMPLRINGDFTPGTYTYAGALADIYGSSAPVSIKITFVNALAITDADLFYGTDPIVIDQALDGTFADGFVMELDPLVEWYYLDTDMVTSNNTLADGRYTFYESTDDTQPIFYLDIAAGEFSLIDAYKWLVDGVISPLRINGDFTPGTYTYIGDVTDIYGSTAPLSIEITFVNALAVTDADLFFGTDPLMIDQLLGGDFEAGFTMALDPTVAWYYLDTNMIEANNPLVDGSYPFYLDGGPISPIFFVKVEETTYTLIDAYQGDPNPLRINGDFVPGTYTYTGSLTDIYGSSAPVSIEITFNDVPYATAQSVTVVEDTPTAITLSGVDLFPGTMTYAVVTNPTHGTLSGTAPALTYTPAADFHGTDSFTFTLSDGTLTSTAATVSITVTSVLDAPIVDSTNLPGPYMVGLEQTFQVTLTNPGNGDAFTNVLARFRLEGITLADIASFQYLETSLEPDQWLPLPLVQDGTGVIGDFGPAAGFPMDVPYSATSQFKVTFNTAGTYPASIVLYDVAADHDVALDSYEADVLVVADLEVTDVVLTRSTDQTTWYNVPGTFADGFEMPLLTTQDYYYFDVSTLTATRPLADGSYPFYLTETPGAEFFAYWADKGVVAGATDWQGLMWQIINGDAPMFYLDVVGTDYSLIDGLQGAPNLLRINGDYYPGDYAFSGIVADAAGFEDEVPVEITFNDIPMAEDQSVSVVEDTATPITLTAVDIFPGTLTYEIVTQPAHGTAVLAGDVVTYTPAHDFVGEDSFSFTANDGTLTSSIGKVNITVTPVKDQVVAVDDAYETNEDTTLAVATPGVRANDIDPDNNLWTVSLVTDVQHGTLSLKGDGSFIYEPDANFYGIDTFEYQLVTYPAPQNLWTDTAIVTITVHPVMDAPTLSTDLPASIYAGYETEFGVTLDNPDYGDSFAGVRVQFRLLDTVLADITSLEYYETTTGTWMNLPLAQDGLDVIGWFGPGFGFPMPAPYTATSQFRLTMAVTGTYDYEMHLFDVVLEPNVLLASLSGSVDVLDAQIFDITDFGLWGETWPGALSLGWQYVTEFDTLDIASIEIGMLDAGRNSIVKYTADEAQVAWQRANGYITPSPDKLSSAPFYVEYNGTPIAEGRDFDWTVVFGPEFAAWDPAWGYVKVVDVNGYEEYEEIPYTGTRPDITPPTVGDAVAVGIAPYDDVTAVDMTFTVPQGYVVDTIQLTMSEPVTVLAGTEVTLAGVPYGLITVDSTGLIVTITPYAGNEVANLIGTFTFSVPAGSVKDLAGHALEEVEATLIVTNIAPVAVDDAYTVAEDGVLTVAARGVLINDTDYDPAILTAVKLTDPANGTLVLNANGSLTYTPAANFHGTDTFTYKANDGLTDSNVATVTITVTAVNDAPIAQDQSVTTPEDSALPITLVATDVDGDTLAYTIVAQPAHGMVILVGNVATYTPALDFNGSDSFTFKANDSTVDSNVATMTITVTAVNDDPMAMDDAYETNEDTTLTVPAPGVLANDGDVDQDDLASYILTQPAYGAVELASDGSFTYIPEPNWNGTDTFTYQLVATPAMNAAWTDEATVTISVNPVDDAPVLDLIEDATIHEIMEFSFTATATDVDLPAQALIFSLVGAPDGAAITADGVFTWTPSEEQGPGVYTFTVVVCDDTVPTPLCDEQEVTLTVNEINVAPVAQDQSVTTPEDTALPVTLVATDAEDETLTYAIVAQPAHGTVTLVGTTATYTPDLDYTGPDSFTFKANDGLADSNIATVTITVTSVNDAPVATDDEYTMAEKETLTIAAPGVLANDSDLDGDTLSAILVDTVSNGTLTLNADGSFTYIPDEYFNGTDSFTYKAKDAVLESDLAVVTIAVTPVNDWPIANDDEYEVVTGTDLVKDAVEGVLANDVLLDPDEEVSIEILEGPEHGTLSMNNDGSFTYTPDAGYMGMDTFRYLLLSVRVNGEWSDDANVTITVKPYMRLFLPIIWR